MKKYINTEEELMEKFNLELLLKEIHKNKLTCKDIECIYGIEQRFMSKYNKEHKSISKEWIFFSAR